MERRKEINGRLVRWIAEKAEREYAEDISLVLIYGSYVNGTANSRSDVDCCFIPKTERGYEMAAGFILEGVGYDIFPMSWERVERIACLRENLTPLVGDAEIIFCGSAEDMARFQGMQEKLQCCLADGAYVREIAEERCREALRDAGACTHGDRGMEAHGNGHHDAGRCGGSIPPPVLPFWAETAI